MLKYLALFLLLISQETLANTVSCSSDSGLPERTINVPVGDIKTTASTGLSSGDYYQSLYTYKAYFLGNIRLDCQSSNGQFVNSLRKIYITPMSGGSPVLYNDGVADNYIFPTSAPGIGVSFSYSPGNVSVANKTAPAILLSGFDSNGVFSWVDRVDITVWKTPDLKNNTTANNRYSLNDQFQFTHAHILDSAADNFSSVPYPDTGISNGWAINRVNLNLNGTMEVQKGTCNFQNKTGFMGHHPLNAGNQPSAWKDASFTVTCDAAWGLAEQASYSDSHVFIGTLGKVKNSGYLVMVNPRTDVVDSNHGIIALKHGGAQGYGIQLAWGKPSMQPSSGEPGYPVLLNQLLFGFLLPDIGFPSFDSGATPQQEFNMSARYVRLPGETVSPGAADASIEVVVTYL